MPIMIFLKNGPANKVASISFNLIGVLLILISLVLFSGNKLIEKTIENNYKIQNSFNQASVYLNEYIKLKSKLPSQSEFDLWASKFDDMAFTPRGLKIINEVFPVEISQKYGRPPNELSYALSYFRGEDYEFYVSWKNESTLSLDKDKYYIFGNWYLDWISFLLAGIGFVLLGVRIRSKNGSARKKET